jgi:hypothetical protein
MTSSVTSYSRFFNLLSISPNGVILFVLVEKDEDCLEQFYTISLASQEGGRTGRQSPVI